MYNFMVVNKFMISDKGFINNINNQKTPFVIISILSPEYEIDEVKIPHSPYCKGRLVVRFHDINDDDGSVNSLKPVTKELISINESHAKNIIDFTLKWKNDIKNFIIHCEAGMSRSPGVAIALSEILNGTENPEAFVQCLYDIKVHNRSVRNMILSEYNKKDKLNISG